MHALVDSLQKANELTVIVVTHLPNEIAPLAETTAFMHDGRVLEHGPTVELLADPQHAELNRYLEFTQAHYTYDF